MTVYPWCGVCGQVAVMHRGDTCVRCNATVEALIHPDDRTTTMRPPRLLTFLRRLGRMA